MSGPATPAPLVLRRTGPENNRAESFKNGSTLPWPMQLAVPVASVITSGIRWLLSKNAPPLDTHSYMLLFWEILGGSAALAIAQTSCAGLRQWMRHMWQSF